VADTRDRNRALRTAEDWRGWDARRKAAPDRDADAAETKAREILRTEGYPDDWRAFAVTMTATDGRALWQCTPAERADLLAKLEAIDPDTRARVYEGPALSLQADLARRALIEIACYRSAGSREHALSFLRAAERLLAAVPRVATAQARAHGGTGRARKAREAAAEHWTSEYLALAHAELLDEGRKRIGRDALAQRARRLASAAGVPDEKRGEITTHRAREFIASITR